MTNWKEYSFSEFVEINPKVALIGNSFYSFVEMKDLNESQKYVLPSQERELKGGARFQDKDTLFARITPCLENGKICQVKGLKNGIGFGSTEFLVFRGKQDVSLTDFVYYLSRSEEVRKFAEQHMVGTSGRQRVAREAFDNLMLTLPNLQTQDSIAEILSSLDDKIELNNKINQELEALAQALFKQWFIDFEFPDANGQLYKSSGGEMVESELGEIPKGWSVGVLSDIIEFSNGNAFTSKELLNENDGDCYHVFKMGHIKKGGGLNADGTKSYYPKSKSSKLLKFVLRKGDLLMCMTDMKGNVALLGHTALMNEDEKYIVNQRVGLLRPKNDLSINYPYLYILTNSTDFIEDLRSRANSGVQVNLSTSEIKNSKVLLPSKELNIAFDKQTKSFFDTIFNIIEENKQLQTLRDTLLPKLISGELAVSESLTKTAS